MQTKFPSHYWSHPQVEAASAEIKCAGAWLLTNERIGLCGHAAVTSARFAFETGLNPKLLARALEALSEWFTPTSDGYFIPGFIGQQIGRGDSLLSNNLCKSLVKGLERLHDPSVVALVVAHYPELKKALKVLFPPEGLITPSQGVLATPEVEREREREGEGEREGESDRDRGAGGREFKLNGHSPAQSRSSRTRRPRPGARIPGEQPEPMQGRMLALNAIFRRQAGTAWSESDVSALEHSGLLTLPEPDFLASCETVRAFYAAKIPREVERRFPRRTSLQTLLNNWAGELDKARLWSRENNDGLTAL